VIVAYEAETGLRLARTEKPDLVILDIMLPKMDGYEICRRFKQDRECRLIPIILVSAVDQKFDNRSG